MDRISGEYLLSLQRLILEQLTLDEIKSLCLGLAVDYDDLWGGDEPGNVWELLDRLFYDYRLQELLNLLEKTKPQVAWPSIPDDFEGPMHEAAVGLESVAPPPEESSPRSGGSTRGDSIGVGDIDGSHVAIGEGASVNVNEGDTYNMSGNFQGATIMIKSSTAGENRPEAAPLIEEEIRLDVATPTEVFKDQVFDVAISVRQPSSPVLIIDDLSSVTSGAGAIFRREADEIVKYRIEITGSGFIVEPKSYTIKLRPNKDSRPYFFQLTPTKLGKKTIVVNAYQEDDTLAAQTRIRMEVVVAMADERQRRAGIPPNLYKQLRDVLLDCGPFATNQELQAVFIDQRLSAWQHRLPQANSQAGRVEAVIHFLHNQHNSAGENALMLLLRVLGKRLDAGDDCHHRLTQLAERL